MRIVFVLSLAAAWCIFSVHSLSIAVSLPSDTDYYIQPYTKTQDIPEKSIMASRLSEVNILQKDGK